MWQLQPDLMARSPQRNRARDRQTGAGLSEGGRKKGRSLREDSLREHVHVQIPQSIRQTALFLLISLLRNIAKSDHRPRFPKGQLLESDGKERESGNICNPNLLLRQ